MKNHLTLSLAALCAFLLSPIQAQETDTLDTSRPPVQLKFDYQTGKTYIQTMQTIQTAKMNIAGQQMDSTTDMTMVMSMEVGAGNEGGKRVKVTYDRMAMKMNMAGQEMAFDSDDPEDGNPLGAGISGFIGQSFILVLDDQHAVVDVEGLDELAAKAGAGNPQTAQMLQQFLSKEHMSQMMNTWIKQGFPDKPVKAGDEWPYDIDMAMPGVGNVGVKGSYAHKGHTEKDGQDCIVIDIQGDITMDLGDAAADDPQAQMLKALGMEVKDASQSGRMYWDNDLGFYRAMTMDQKFTISMNNPQTGEKMVVPTVMKLNATVEVK